ncbi:hypothetical protein BJD58_gp81 [Gordonia phage UmaThurman]|uniref:hypothetical protein n=1 Tax=Gordonia phage Utz TaxID=1838081 RepID=UPI00078B2BA5|nr:hypothetical protein BH796_gp69 [Gordonia phage Utz]YP_009302917.1 hypothetical protein BJD58_gp81 [Gordonia phage UmaThurman]AMS03981.1 hypothetical protein SEA_UMATHURMAN_81 [Gordonia phage UmaThurman]ANA86936.1 hypothetical protein PBI_UTZ_69 [Gordonia phage Utz]
MTAPLPPIRPNDDAQAQWVRDWLIKSHANLSITWQRQSGLGDVFRLFFGEAEAAPPSGVWMAYNSDHSSAVPFPTEIEALRHAVAYPGMLARLVQWGTDVTDLSEVR